MSLKVQLRERNGDWFGRHMINGAISSEVNLETRDRGAAATKIADIARREYECLGTPFTGVIEVIPEPTWLGSGDVMWRVIKYSQFFSARFRDENGKMIEMSLEPYSREAGGMTRQEAEIKAEELAIAANRCRVARSLAKGIEVASQTGHALLGAPPTLGGVTHEEMWRADLAGTDDGNVKEVCDAVDDPQVIRVIKADNFAVVSSGGGGAPGGSGSGIGRLYRLPGFSEFNRAFKEGEPMFINGKPATVQRAGGVAVVTWNDEGPAPTARVEEVAAVDQKDKQASYVGYARQVVARAAQAGLRGEQSVKTFDALSQDQSLEALVFPRTDVGTLDRVDVGAPRQLSEGLKRALEQVRAALPADERQDDLLEAIDEIETALSGERVMTIDLDRERAKGPLSRASRIFDKATHETMTALGLPVLQRPESAPVISNMSQGEFERCMDTAAQMISDHEREREEANAPLLNVEKSGRVTFAEDTEDENVIRQGGGWATFRRGGAWWIECTARRAGEHFMRVSFSMHTDDEAVAGARFFEFRERHRETAIDSLLEATREERAAWVK